MSVFVTALVIRTESQQFGPFCCAGYFRVARATLRYAALYTLRMQVTECFAIMHNAIEYKFIRT